MYLVNTWYTKVVTRIYDSEESDDYTTPLTLKHNGFDSTSNADNRVGERDDWEDRGEEALAALLLGPTGNLRAPTLRRGTTLVVGFNADLYDSLFG